MDETVLFEIGGEAEGALASFEAVDAALASMEERIAAVIEAAVGLDDLTGSLGALSDMAVGADAAVSGLSDSLMGVETQAAMLASSVEAAAASTTELADAASAATASTGAEANALTANAAAADTTAAAHGRAGQSSFFLDRRLAAASLAAVAAGAAFVYFGAQAQDSLNVVASLTGASASQMQQYTDGAIQLSTQLGSSLKATGDGLYYVVSAGFSNADALKVLKPAMEDAAAGGADLSDVANGLTSAMNAYGASADQATQYSDVMIAAVTNGKQTFGDFARGIGVAAVTGKTAGFSFSEVAAAEATMTQSGLTAHRAVMDLDFTMRAIGLSVDKVADTANGLGLSFDKTKYSSLDLIGKLEYLKDISGGNMAAFEKLVGGANGLTAAQILLAKNGDTYNGVLDKMKNSTGATDAAFKTHEATLSAHANHLGAAFSVLAFRFVQLITPGLGAFFDRVTAGIAGLTTNAERAMPVVAGLAALIAGVLVAALWAMVAPIMATIGAALPLILAVAALAAGAALVAANWQRLTGFFSSSEPVAVAVKLAIAALGVAALLFGVSQIPALIAGAIAAVPALLGMAAATWAAITPVLIAAAPFIAIGVAIVGLGFIIYQAVTHWDQLRAAVGNFINNAMHSPWGIIAALILLPLAPILALIVALKLLVDHWDDVKKFFGNLLDAIKDLPSHFGDLGRAIIEGLIQAFTGMAPQAIHAMENLAGQLLGGFKNALGIHSPSQAFAEAGASVGDGFMLGLLAKSAAIQDALHQTITAPAENAARRVPTGVQRAYDLDVAGTAGSTGLLAAAALPAAAVAGSASGGGSGGASGASGGLALGSSDALAQLKQINVTLTDMDTYLKQIAQNTAPVSLPTGGAIGGDGSASSVGGVPSTTADSAAGGGGGGGGGDSGINFSGGGRNSGLISGIPGADPGGISSDQHEALLAAAAARRQRQADDAANRAVRRPGGNRVPGLTGFGLS